jgi:hypothetical protein
MSLGSQTWSQNALTATWTSYSYSYDTSQPMSGSVNLTFQNTVTLKCVPGSDCTVQIDNVEVRGSGAMFNQNVGAWNTASVSNMASMFNGAAPFNQNLSGWNVLRVSNFASAFDSTTALSKSTKGAMYMMWGATLQAAYPTWSCGNAGMLTCPADGNIGSAVTEWVTNPSKAAATYGPIGYWDVSAVSKMEYLFLSKPTFNADIGNWNVASVSNMYNTFVSATAFNQNIGKWNVASVTSMYGTFWAAAAFNADISSWNVASVSAMSFAFRDASTFNQNIRSWNTARVASIEAMFHRALAFNADISLWNVLRVTNVALAFDSTSALSQIYKFRVYSLWGATLAAAYPTWSMYGYALASQSATCPPDTVAPIDSQCWSAYQAVKAQDSATFSYNAKRELVNGTWGNVPVGCSVQYADGQDLYVSTNQDQSPHWNNAASSDNTRLNSGEFRLLCRVPSPIPSPTPSPSSSRTIAPRCDKRSPVAMRDV